MSSTLTINSNLASLDAQRRLSESTASLQQSFERLSSGLRINKASDDAAGLAIASSLNTDARVYTVGVRNVNDATSFYSIAEGALNSLVDITTRLKELAEQSSNGVLSLTQRKSLDAEAQALGKEYQRIKQTTQFNGLNVFDPSLGPLNVQVGYSTLSLAGGNAATGTFATAQTYSTGINPVSVTTADVNGDGIVDLISAESTTSQVSVFIGNGNGTFQAAQTYSTGSAPSSVTTADVNGDGVADLISANALDSTLRVLLGNGNGSFRAAQSFGTTLNPLSLTTADVNGDGIVDLISEGVGSNTVGVSIGNGDGSFRAAQGYGTGINPVWVTAADVNGDGVVDIISADKLSFQVSVFIGNGNGSFKVAQTYATGSNPISVATADVNGDGLIDLISADSTANTLSVLVGNGNGSFRVAQTYATGAAPISLTTADVNGDGMVDLISTDVGQELDVFTGNGDGSFRVAQTYATGAIPGSLTTADVNGDGAVDIISADRLSSQLSVFLGNSAAAIAVALPIGDYSLLSQTSSRQALSQFSGVLNSLTSSLGAVGANDSRLQIATNVLQETRINYQSAASQIQDVDVASEAANLAKGNILQQASAAVLAQANQQPAIALTLLRGA